MGLDTSVPSTRALQKLIAEKQSLEIKVVTGDLLVGKLLWQDPEVLCLGLEGEQRILLWRANVVFIKPL